MDGRLALPDGRTLAYREWGDPVGRPLLRLQGTPGSRLSVPPLHSDWARRDLRVVMADRPGFGASTRLPGRGIAAVADDYVALLDHLEIEAVPVLAVSGGAPHGLAFAARHPDRVLALTVVVGVAPMTAEDLPLLVGANATSVRLAALGWDALHEFTQQQRAAMVTDPVGGLRASMLNAPEDDIRTMSDPQWQEAYSQGLREALAGGAEGWTDEVMAVLSPWDFPVDQVRHHVVWWAGAEDANCPLPAVRRLLARLPSAQLHVWEGVGHLAQYLRAEEFLPDLLDRGFAA